MKISSENGPVSRRTEDARHRQQTQRSGEQLKDAGTKFSSALKEPKTKEGRPKAGRDQRRDDNPFDSAGARRGDGATEKTHHRQQTQRSGEQLKDAGAKFSSALGEAKTREERSEAGRDQRQDDSLSDSAAARRGEGVIANADNTRLETPTVAKSAQAAPVGHDVNQIAQQVAARILVSPPGAANPEVRIQLKESVLQGSDVRILREGGALKVVFVASSQEAANFIAANRDSMATALSDRLPGERVDISVETQQSERERSEHGEGRSRQQYVADDDADALDMKR